MKIDRIELRKLRVPLKAPFRISGGCLEAKECVLVAAGMGELSGHGESVAFPTPYYSEETTGTVWHLLAEILIPRVLGREFKHPRELAEWFADIRRNCMAIAAIEGAAWDLWCRAGGVSLAAALGGTRGEIDVGVSVGIEGSIETVLDNIERFLGQGYQRIKVKIKPGFDLGLIAAIRGRFGPQVPLMADANSAYTLDDIPLLRKLDAYDLTMIEQPLAHDDLIDHAKLQREIRTPVCLDESIHSVDDARKALELGSCRIINIKIGRVGGLTRAVALHNFCRERRIPVWCGGMLELGVGRAHNIAIASLPGFVLPGDTSASHRSYAEDIVTPPIDFCAPGRLAVPTAPGIGYEVDPVALEKFTVAHETFQLHEKSK